MQNLTSSDISEMKTTDLRKANCEAIATFMTARQENDSETELAALEIQRQLQHEIARRVRASKKNKKTTRKNKVAKIHK